MKARQVGMMVVVGVVCLTGRAMAQQQPLYSQYMLDAFLVNPAVAGAEGVTAINLTARQQWMGYSDAPSTYALSAQTRILKTSFRNRSRLVRSRVRRRRPSGKVGLGAFVFNDNNGRIHRTGFQGTYSYHIYMRDYQLSFGASISAFQFKANVTNQDGYTQENDMLLVGKTSKFAPDANVGVLFSGNNFYAGLSITSLFQSSIQFGGGNSETAYRLLRQYYIVGGYRYQPYRSDYAIEPSILFTTTERLQLNADFNVKGYYKDNYWVGVSVRTSGAVVTMIGMKYQQFYFGYAYDYNFSDVSNISSAGSHELMIGLKLGDSARRYRWLNRF